MKVQDLKRVVVRFVILTSILGAFLAIGGTRPALAGNIYLTGHDVLLHGGQNGYDGVTLDFLRGVGTGSVEDKGTYDIAVIGSGVGFASFSGGASFTTSPVGALGDPIPLAGTLAGYGSATYYHATTADWADVLTRDALVILSHTSCGGCDISDADVVAINAQAAPIAAAFNADMDIWGLSGASSATYYGFLPPGAVASGLPIGGSSGFEATAAGLAIGITDGVPPSMINGFPTHNRFVDFDTDFTVFEIRPQTGVDEVISIGLRGGTIIDGTIIIDDDGGPTVPEPATLILFSSGLLGLGVWRRLRLK